MNETLKRQLELLWCDEDPMPYAVNEGKPLQRFPPDVKQIELHDIYLDPNSRDDIKFEVDVKQLYKCPCCKPEGNGEIVTCNCDVKPEKVYHRKDGVYDLLEPCSKPTEPSQVASNAINPMNDRLKINEGFKRDLNDFEVVPGSDAKFEVLQNGNLLVTEIVRLKINEDLKRE